MPSKPLRSFFLRIFLVLTLLMVLFPFIWCVLISVQGEPEVNSTYALLLPRSLQFKNYLTVLRNTQFVQGFVNSLIISLLSVALNLLLSVPAGFAMARIKTPLMQLCLRAMLLFVFVPVILLALPMYDMMSEWGLRGTRLMTALPMCALTMTTLTFHAFYSRFPSEMDDCAVLLGITPVRSFLTVYLPVSGRMIAYAAIVQFVTTWNCAFLPMFLYRGPEGLQTVQEALLQFALMPRSIFLGMAAVLLTCLPCWLLYVLRNAFGNHAHRMVADPFRNSN